MKIIFYCFIFLFMSSVVIAQTTPKKNTSKGKVTTNKKVATNKKKGRSKQIAKKDMFKTTPNGLKYIHHISNKTPKAKLNDILSFQFVMTVQSNGADSVLRNTFREPVPFAAKVMEPQFKGGLEEGFLMLAKNDSISFLVKADSLFKQGMPPFVDKKSNVRFDIRVLDITSEQVFMETRQREVEAKTAAQKGIDEKLIVDYLQKNGINNAKRTNTGLYYVVSQLGEGDTLTTGKKVGVHYLGKLLDGTKFDSSYDRGQPLDFAYNTGSMIKGFDEGVGFIKKGGKATLYIPSHLGYGERAAGTIPPFSVLIFEIELMTIE
jgi:FKBP-type peptidyl-prolyl cis-trans isomerase FkpA